MPGIIPKKYCLNDGSVYWHRLYFSIVPKWMTKYSPPLSNYNYAACLYQPHKYVWSLYLQAKWFVQRGRRGYSDNDAWSLDWYLCDWMPQALTMLKNRKIGHPMGLTKRSWDAKLDKMIRAFRIARKVQDYDYNTTKECQAAIRQFRKDFDVFKNYYFSLWD